MNEGQEPTHTETIGLGRDVMFTRRAVFLAFVVLMDFVRCFAYIPLFIYMLTFNGKRARLVVLSDVGVTAELAGQHLFLATFFGLLVLHL